MRYLFTLNGTIGVEDNEPEPYDGVPVVDDGIERDGFLCVVCAALWCARACDDDELAAAFRRRRSIID